MENITVNKADLLDKVRQNRADHKTEYEIALSEYRRVLGEKLTAKLEEVENATPEEARKIHYGEADARGIIGRATPDEAQALVEEGIEIAAIPVLPDDIN